MTKTKVKVRLRGVYTKPLKVTLDRPSLMKAGQIILQSVRREIRKDASKARMMSGRGKPVTIPDTEAFVKSFTFQITGKVIEIVSSWPTAEAHTKPGNDNPRKMTWLVQPKVKHVPIITGSGKVIVRTAPMTTANAWIHPGFTKYNFIERGVRKGRQAVLDGMGQRILDHAVEQGVFK
jgi:hypothetical protein